MRLKLFLVTVYLACFILTYGMALGDLSHKFPHNCREHAGFAVLYAIPSPVTTVAVWALSGFAQYGLQFTCPSEAK